MVVPAQIDTCSESLLKESHEEAKKRGGSKALVARDIVRFVTAGTLTEEAQSCPAEHAVAVKPIHLFNERWLALLVPPYMRRPTMRLAYCTGMRRWACST